MKTITLKTFFGLTVTLSFLILALITKDAVHSQLLSSFGIVSGAFAAHLLSK